jgi:cytochrome c oxidase cbb3-type subunit 3
VRSVLVLHDRYGSELAPFLKRGHKTQSGTPSANLTEAQVVDLANFLRQRVNDSLRGSPIFQVQDVLTGDAKAGSAYFNGPGQCTTCHSAAANNLAGIATRIATPVDLQQRMLFPGGRGGGRGAPAAGVGAPNPNAVTVTLTPPSGPPMSGVLLQIDDFYVTFRDAAGALHVVMRTPGLKVVRTDPLQAHHELLDRITDKNIHDLVAYLETLK